MFVPAWVMSPVCTPTLTRENPYLVDQVRVFRVRVGVPLD